MAGIQYVVNAIDGASTTFGKIARSADALNAQLADLSKQNATPSVELQDKIFQTKVTSAKASIAELSKRIADPAAELKDKVFNLGIADAQVKLDRLSAKVSKPKIELRGLHTAELGILKISAELDKLDARRVDVPVDVHVDRHGLMSRLGGLFGGGGGGGLRGLLGMAGGAAQAGGAAASTGSGALSALGPQAQAAGIGAAIAALVSMGPALLPTLLGVGVGGGAAAGAFAVGSKANKQMQTLAKQLATAKGPAKQDILSQMAALRKSSAPELAIFGAFQDLGHSALGTFTSALESKGPGFSAGPGGQAGAPSFLTGLTGILKQLGGFIKTIGPSLGAMFRASLPFLGAFVKALEQAAKVLLPVFTASLRQMQPFLPMISQGLLAIVQGLAGMIKAMGPGGMKAAAQIFVALCKAMEGILIAVGYAANFMAEMLRDVGLKIRQRVSDWHRTFDDFRHRTAVIFDGVRHDIAHVWDLIWNNTIGRWIRGQQDITKIGGQIQHGIASTFDAIRHTVASWLHDIANAFDQFRHFQGQAHAFWKDIAWVWTHIHDMTVATWDFIRHYLASVLDAIRHSIAAEFDAIRHGIAAVLDAIRHGIAAAWDAIWHHSQDQARSGVSGVVGFFAQMPGRILGVLRHLPGQLWNLARTAIENIIKGAQSVVPHITSFFTGFAHGIVSIFKKIWGWFSPSAVMFEGGKSLMEGLERGIKAHAHKAINAASSVAGMVGGKATGSLQHYAQSLLDAMGWGGQWPAFNSLVMAESGWNVHATNPTSGAYGIPQALPPGKMASAGPDWRTSGYTQLRWMMSYIKSVYGSPNAAWAHETRFHWYGSGLRDGLFTRPTIIGVGERGPERVNVEPASSGKRQPASVSLTQNGDVYIRDPVDWNIVSGKLSFAVTASGFG